jgi:hypothetical protein
VSERPSKGSCDFERPSKESCDFGRPSKETAPAKRGWGRGFWAMPFGRRGKAKEASPSAPEVPATEPPSKESLGEPTAEETGAEDEERRRLGRPPPLTTDECLAKCAELEDAWHEARQQARRLEDAWQEARQQARANATSSGVSRSFFRDKRTRESHSVEALWRDVAPAEKGVTSVTSWSHLDKCDHLSDASPSKTPKWSDQASSPSSSGGGGTPQYKIPNSFKRRHNAAAAL